MKVYPKTFENVFTSDRALFRCKLEEVKILGFESTSDYIAFARKELRSLLEGYWRSVVRASWLFLKFTYKGQGRPRLYSNDTNVDAAFAVFHKQHVGVDIKAFARSAPHFNKLFDYFVEYYPEFKTRNPFTEPEYYKFPYKNISIDHMITVYQMPERVEILAYIEEHPMNFNEYLDWVINYINSYNEEKGENIYEFYTGKEAIPYVRYKNYKQKDNLKKYNLKRYDPTKTKAR